MIKEDQSVVHLSVTSFLQRLVGIASLRLWKTRYSRHEIPETSAFFSRIDLTFTTTLKTFRFMVTVAMLSHNHSTVTCNRGNRQAHLLLLLSCFRPGIYVTTKKMACYLSDEEMIEFSKCHTTWKIILEPMTCSVVISEVDAVTYVVLSKAEKHVPNGEFVGTTEMCGRYG
jgi:hypothetical protein